MGLIVAYGVWLGAGAGLAWAGTANGGLSGASARDPLAGMTWGIYRGPIDGVYPAYQSAHGRNKRLMAKIALQPLTIWAGAWYPDNYARTVAQQIIQATTAGNPDVLSQVAIFRLDPWEGQACPGSWGPADQGSYRAWINQFAVGIGSSRVALILQPDLPFALCAPSPVPLQLVAYAAESFNALRHTTVYIDVGAAEWASVSQAVSLLERAGIRHARGFSLNVTQYGSTGMQLEYGGQIVQALAAAGIPGKHFVINTDENGAPFLAGQYPGNANEARACSSPNDKICVTLGIPPTTDVANPSWGLSAADRAIATNDADAYMWAGRPWVDNDTGSFVFSRALQLAASTPF
ncbi:MAG: glycoside hydrolase family 6 protein [Solirubrobacteraceae bacterium]